MISLSRCIDVRRRYVRSVNLERDLDLAGGLDGYTVTPRVSAALRRIVLAQISPGSARAWTITGVYGSGKSAFAHFLATLVGPKGSMRVRACSLLNAGDETRSLAKHFQTRVAEEGMIRAIAVGRREPIGHTVLRAVLNGAETFWSKRRGVRPKALDQLRGLQASISEGQAADTTHLAELTRDLARASRTGLLLIIDELGKVLESAGSGNGTQDLYLLQQLAESTAGNDESPILLAGLLHQAFAEYGTTLSLAERNEWDKVQGRFEDITFTGPTEEMLFLLGRAIERKVPADVDAALGRRARSWHKYLTEQVSHPYVARILLPELIDAAYPLHPLVALILPSLCSRFAQNDRSLFTFLTSNEPHGLRQFVDEVSASSDYLPTLQLDEVYNYFASILSGGAAARPQLQRWAEVHGVVQDARGLGKDELRALKTIATLNLLSTTGPLRASRGLVTAALLGVPGDRAEIRKWHSVLDSLVAQKLMTYRSQVDEFRVWQGSDFDVDAEARMHFESEHRALAEALNEIADLAPIVAQRHSYKTGTLRYFERCFIDTAERLERVRCKTSAADGVVAYWVGHKEPAAIPECTEDGRPLVVARIQEPDTIRSAVFELAALRTLERNALELQTDGVARREVRMRLRLAQDVLDGALRNALDPRRFERLWIQGRKAAAADFRSALSGVCDTAYPYTPILWNELVNRRELTSQGARAQRELIEALLTHADEERLGLVGNGPAYSMYASLFQKTGIHRKESTRWGVHSPKGDDVSALWKGIEDFCLDAKETSRTLDQLYSLLEAPPYGVKRGIIPVFLAAVLVAHEEDLTVYREGSFIPVLGPEHFELLVKHPVDFAVKHFVLTGIRRELFRDLESMLSESAPAQAGGTRNATLLGVVRPLVRFATTLPKVTLTTERVSEIARQVRQALLTASEPDRLLFEALPEACGFPPFQHDVRGKRADYHRFRQTLQAALRDLSLYYESLLGECRNMIYGAFGIRSTPAGLREDLRIRAQYLAGQCIEPRLRSFIMAASRSEGDERQWLESLVMIIADRPLETWSESNAVAFETNVADMVRRFANLEALQKEAARNHAVGYEARRITITRADGVELSDLVWLDADQSQQVNAHVARLLEELRAVSPEHQRHAIAVTVLEQLIGASHSERNEKSAPRLKREASRG